METKRVPVSLPRPVVVLFSMTGQRARLQCDVVGPSGQENNRVRGRSFHRGGVQGVEVIGRIGMCAVHHAVAFGARVRRVGGMSSAVLVLAVVLTGAAGMAGSAGRGYIQGSGLPVGCGLAAVTAGIRTGDRGPREAGRAGFGLEGIGSGEGHGRWRRGSRDPSIGGVVMAQASELVKAVARRTGQCGGKTHVRWVGPSDVRESGHSAGRTAGHT
jgi:hypothetical protein